MSKCGTDKCPMGASYKRSPYSDACDSCRSDPNTGWGGSTDHSKDNNDEVDEGDGGSW